jgi:hypothetical protein
MLLYEKRARGVIRCICVVTEVVTESRVTRSVVVHGAPAKPNTPSGIEKRAPPRAAPARDRRVRDLIAQLDRSNDARQAALGRYVRAPSSGPYVTFVIR